MSPNFPDSLSLFLRPDHLQLLDNAAAAMGQTRAEMVRAMLAQRIDWNRRLGRKKPAHQSHTRPITIPLPPRWKRRIEDEAARAGKNRSEWIRDAIIAGIAERDAPTEPDGE